MYSMRLDEACYCQIISICLQHSRFGASKVALAIRARSGAYECYHSMNTNTVRHFSISHHHSCHRLHKGKWCRHGCCRTSSGRKHIVCHRWNRDRCRSIPDEAGACSHGYHRYSEDRYTMPVPRPVNQATEAAGCASPQTLQIANAPDRRSVLGYDSIKIESDETSIGSTEEYASNEEDDSPRRGDCLSKRLIKRAKRRLSMAKRRRKILETDIVLWEKLTDQLNVLNDRHQILVDTNSALEAENQKLIANEQVATTRVKLLSGDVDSIRHGSDDTLNETVTTITDALKRMQGELFERNRLAVSCVVCLDKQKTILLQPCNHLCLCENCEEMMTKCPLCRERIETKVKVRA